MNTSAASQEARDAMRESTSEGRAETTADSVVSDALDKEREAPRAMRDVSDNFIDAIDETIKTRPLHHAGAGCGGRLPLRGRVAALTMAGRSAPYLATRHAQSSATVASPLIASSATLALNSAENRLRVLMVDHPPRRRIHLSRLCQDVGPPLSCERPRLFSHPMRLGLDR